MSLKNKVEAILFAVGKRIAVEDIMRLCQENRATVETALQELAHEYTHRDSSLRLTHVDDRWKIDIREEYLELVKNIVVETDLSRPTMETLSLIAYKKRALQSDIVKQRGVGAYDHIRELLDLGFITREKEGRS